MLAGFWVTKIVPRIAITGDSTGDNLAAGLIDDICKGMLPVQYQFEGAHVYPIPLWI